MDMTYLNSVKARILVLVYFQALVDGINLQRQKQSAVSATAHCYYRCSSVFTGISTSTGYLFTHNYQSISLARGRWTILIKTTEYYSYTSPTTIVTMRWAMGHPFLKTPHMERMAQEGAILKCFCDYLAMLTQPCFYLFGPVRA